MVSNSKNVGEISFMKYDQTFARFARRMIRQTAIAAGIFAMAGTMYWNWQVGAGVVAGGLYQILFLSFLSFPSFLPISQQTFVERVDKRHL